jgi:hypothetical protein
LNIYADVGFFIIITLADLYVLIKYTNCKFDTQALWLLGALWIAFLVSMIQSILFSSNGELNLLLRSIFSVAYISTRAAFWIIVYLYIFKAEEFLATHS